MSLDEYQLLFGRLERRLRETRAVDVVANVELHLNTKSDFLEESNLKAVAEALKATGLDAELLLDEEHSAWTVIFKDHTNAARAIDLEFAALPEYKRLRALARQIAKSNQPPFVAVKEDHREKLANWRDLLAYVKNEGTREVTVQRYKGLGEMNAEQLWSTTMNAETRTLLRVSVEDLVQCDEIFTTLMGEDVESRRKFIEDNALDVRNLDV